uniref:hypothetical protein n=1 Tax=Bradyrhizobium vignae TaxID=1549949 RepID=UPI0035DE77FC
MSEALSALKRELAGLYWSLGRLPIPPEKLRLAMLPQAVESIRAERLRMERLEDALLSVGSSKLA